MQATASLAGDYIGAAHAATSTTTTRKLIDTPLASVVATGGQVKLVRIASNSWQASGNSNCPDGSVFGDNKMAKCFNDAADYADKCPPALGSTPVSHMHNSQKYATVRATCTNGWTYDSTYTDCKLTCGAHSSQYDVDTCACDTGYYVTDTGAQYYSDAGNSCDDTSAGYMQDFTAADCANYPTPTTSTGYTPIGKFMDRRDGNLYEVRKYADGRCWMAQNLKFGNCASLTGNDFNSYYQISVIDKVAPGYYGICRNAADGGNYDGYLYNWQAAMNNSTAYYNTTFDGRTNGSTEATHDICPLGWHLPTGGNNGEFQKLADAVEGKNVPNGCTSANCPVSWAWFRTSGANAWNASGMSAVAGYAYGSSLYDQGSHANWWSSTVNSASIAYSLYLYSSDIYPQNTYNKYLGFSVRCIQDSGSN